MTYAEAQTEFSTRLYRWAKGALEREVIEGFPRFQGVKDWSRLRCLFLQSLDDESRTLFAQHILRMRHQNAAEAFWGEASTKAEVLMRLEDAFRSESNAWVRVSGSDADRTRKTLASRREIKKAVGDRFRTAFGKDWIRCGSEAGKTGLRYRNEYHGWVVLTEFEFGRWDPEITCVHDIWTGKLITREDPQVLVANCLGFQMNYGNEIGIGSGWERIAVDDVDQTCSIVMEHCQRLFDILPMLLESLDLKSLVK